MGNCNREIRVRGKQTLTDVRAKILLYDCIFFRNLRILKSENDNYLHTLPHARKGITWPLMNGESGYRFITKSYLFPDILLGQKGITCPLNIGESGY